MLDEIKSFFKKNILYIIIAILVIGYFFTFLIPMFSNINTKIVDEISKTENKIEDIKSKEIEQKAKFEVQNKVIEEKKEQKLKELDNIVQDTSISKKERNKKLNDFHKSIKKFQ